MRDATANLHDADAVPGNVGMTDTEGPRTFEGLGILMRFHAFPSEVQDKYCLVEAVVPPGFGAPPNHHAGETEAFYVLDGTVEFSIDGDVRRVGAGGFVPIPDGALHAFTSVGEGAARLLILNAPGHMHARFFRAVGEPVDEAKRMPSPPAGPPDLERVLAAARAVGMTLQPPAP